MPRHRRPRSSRRRALAAGAGRGTGAWRRQLQAGRTAHAELLRWVAAAAHDLRQPLHALNLGAATLDQRLQQQPDATLKAVADGLGRALALAQGLVDEVLAVAAPGGAASPPSPPQPVPAVQVDALLAGLLSDFQPLAVQRGLALRLQAPVPAAWQVRAPPLALQRVLHNLLANALQHTGHGGVTLAVLADPPPGGPVAPAGGGRWLCVQVHDTGPGLSPALQQRLFEPGQRGPGAARHHPRGLGLGLATVRLLTQALGWPLQWHSTPGAGSCFSLWLPRLADATA